MTFTAPADDFLVFEATATDGDGNEYVTRITLLSAVPIDPDGDGLIDIDDLTMLHNMRHNLAGTSYKASTASDGNSLGCPLGVCTGYELTGNLDFDTDGDGTWSVDNAGNYTLDAADNQAPYFEVTNGAGGWLPIGSEANPFTAVFDGNGHRIHNLAIRRDQRRIALFGAIAGTAAIRNIGLVDNLADYTGSNNGNNYVGGLVGLLNGGSITASYARGNVDGGGGNEDSVGALVGRQSGGSITASYATGNADGRDGSGDAVGGLVGRKNGGSITASYATGNADGGDGNNDEAGGLVGRHSVGSITASYATGNVDGGGGGGDRVGTLVGRRFGSPQVTHSYGFGARTGGESPGGASPMPTGVMSATELTAANAGASSWNEAGNNTLGAWNFGNSSQRPLLNYADYDGTGGTFDCDQFPPSACDTLLPGQGGVTLSFPSLAVLSGDPVSLTGSSLDDRIPISSWRWERLEGQTVPLTGANSSDLSFTAPTVTAPGEFLFRVTAVDGDGFEYTGFVPLIVVDRRADEDGNRLIEIDSLTRLHNMRHNLAGTSYKVGPTSLANTLGCPNTGCNGYELTVDLDFDTDGDGDGTWSLDGNGNLILDAGDSQSPYFEVTNSAGGWQPVGDGANPFNAVFEGSNNTISNLAIRRDTLNLGFFGSIGANAEIRNLGLIGNLTDYTGSNGNAKNIGGLVGWQQGGSITASHATGDVDGGTAARDRIGVLVGAQSDGVIAASYATGNANGRGGDDDRVGALVGWQEGGLITDSHATGNIEGSGGNQDSAGGLLGWQTDGSITASYATGNAVVGGGNEGFAGALVGRQQNGSITASYATGNADGGGGNNDRVGALVGRQVNGSITASYATGNADGGGGNNDSAGALVGRQENGSITASYATGNAHGGDGDDDAAGALVGRQSGGSITDSYGFAPTTGERAGDAGSTRPEGVGGPTDLTADNAGTSWNADGSNTLGAWDFGSDSQIPALRYADYDGSGATFDCDQFPAGVTCGTTLLPRQAGLVAGGSSFLAVENGSGGVLSVAAAGRILISSWSWQQLEGAATVILSSTITPEVSFTVPDDDFLVFEVTATDGDGNDYVMRITLRSAPVVDRDGNGLIDIDSLTRLHNMRYNRAGLNYRTSANSYRNTVGCPGTECIGYELTRDLDFDTDGNGTWSGNSSDGYTLDSNDSMAPYFVVTNGAGGWQPIGSGSSPFTAVFEGNGYSIRNLAIRRGDSDIGFFSVINGSAAIRNLGLIDNLTDYTGNSDSGKSVGGLVGWHRGGSITASYVTGNVDGGSGNQDRVGVLVGAQFGGSIVASYATGNAYGRGGNNDRVGVLVGWQQNGSITASYATGNADGGGGDNDSAGALVGWQHGGSITASYATGNADGGGGNNDSAGALVGRQEGGSIRASYATGYAAGGDGSGDSAGALVGRKNGGTIAASYGFGSTMAELAGDAGTARPTGVVGPLQLTADNAGTSWNAAANNTLDAWDFGTDSQVPVLRYADYDGIGTLFVCSQFPAGIICGTTFLPRQAGLIIGSPLFPAVVSGSRALLTATAAGRGVTIASWAWRQLAGPIVTLSSITTPAVTFLAPDNDFLVFEVTATDGDGNDYVTRISLLSAPLVDGDGDGLIDIDSLTRLYNMRHNMAGTSYRTSTISTSLENTVGCPQGICTGYELTGDLDFDADGDGSTWSVDGDGNYSLDAGDHQTVSFEVTDGAGGWLPIGDVGNRFTAIFEGNGYRIRNLAIRRGLKFLGLFGATDGNAIIRNLGLVANLTEYNGPGDGDYIYVGGLVGIQFASLIVASHATGPAVYSGSTGPRLGLVGGLVGEQQNNDARITASYATGDVRGGTIIDIAGGLVGKQLRGVITASYATGNVDGGGNDDHVGGLVGMQVQDSATAAPISAITASYATGNVNGGSGNQ